MINALLTFITSLFIIFFFPQLGGKVKSISASKPGEGIIKAAEEEKGHLIVVGSRGQGAIRRTLVGSVSDYIIHHAHIPVFVCKHPGKHVQPEELEKVHISS